MLAYTLGTSIIEKTTKIVFALLGLLCCFIGSSIIIVAMVDTNAWKRRRLYLSVGGGSNFLFGLFMSITLLVGAPTESLYYLPVFLFWSLLWGLGSMILIFRAIRGCSPLNKLHKKHE